MARSPAAALPPPLPPRVPAAKRPQQVEPLPQQPDISYDTIMSVTHLPQREAAKTLGVPESKLRDACWFYGMLSWPRKAGHRGRHTRPDAEGEADDGGGGGGGNDNDQRDEPADRSEAGGPEAAAGVSAPSDPMQVDERRQDEAAAEAAVESGPGAFPSAERAPAAQVPAVASAGAHGAPAAAAPSASEDAEARRAQAGPSGHSADAGATQQSPLRPAPAEHQQPSPGGASNDITFDQILAHSHLSEKDAAKALGVPYNRLFDARWAFGIVSWPRAHARKRATYPWPAEEQRRREDPTQQQEAGEEHGIAAAAAEPDAAAAAEASARPVVAETSGEQAQQQEQGQDAGRAEQARGNDAGTPEQQLPPRGEPMPLGDAAPDNVSGSGAEDDSGAGARWETDSDEEARSSSESGGGSDDEGPAEPADTAPGDEGASGAGAAAEAAGAAAAADGATAGVTVWRCLDRRHPPDCARCVSAELCACASLLPHPSVAPSLAWWPLSTLLPPFQRLVYCDCRCTPPPSKAEESLYTWRKAENKRTSEVCYLVHPGFVTDRRLFTRHPRQEEKGHVGPGKCSSC